MRNPHNPRPKGSTGAEGGGGGWMVPKTMSGGVAYRYNSADLTSP